MLLYDTIMSSELIGEKKKEGKKGHKHSEITGKAYI